MQPARAARLDEGGHPDVVEQLADAGGGLPHHLEGRARLRVEVDPQLVGMVLVGRAHRPRVEPEAAEVHRPEEVGEIGDHERP